MSEITTLEKLSEPGSLNVLNDYKFKKQSEEKGFFAELSVTLQNQFTTDILSEKGPLTGVVLRVDNKLQPPPGSKLEHLSKLQATGPDRLTYRAYVLVDILHSMLPLPDGFDDHTRIERFPQFYPTNFDSQEPTAGGLVLVDFEDRKNLTGGYIVQILQQKPVVTPFPSTQAKKAMTKLAGHGPMSGTKNSTTNQGSKPPSVLHVGDIGGTINTVAERIKSIASATMVDSRVDLTKGFAGIPANLMGNPAFESDLMARVVIAEIGGHLPIADSDESKGIVTAILNRQRLFRKSYGKDADDVFSTAEIIYGRSKDNPNLKKSVFFNNKGGTDSTGIAYSDKLAVAGAHNHYAKAQQVVAETLQDSQKGIQQKIGRRTMFTHSSKTAEEWTIKNLGVFKIGRTWFAYTSESDKKRFEKQDNKLL